MKNLVILALAIIAVIQGYFLATSNKADFTKVKRNYEGEVVAKVNGDAIKEGEIIERLNFVTRGRADNIKLNTLDNNALEALSKEAYVQRLVLDDAAKMGVQKDPETVQRAAEIIHALYKEKALEKIAEDAADEAAIKAKYEQLKADTAGKKQFKVRHILLKDEAQAKAAREKVNNNNFDQAAKELSIDKASAARGGDLGYIFPEEFIPEFGAAVKSLKENEISQPIKTEFGFHIVQVQDSKDAEILPYEQAKEGVKRQLASEAVKNFVAEKAKDLKVEVLLKTDASVVTPTGDEAAKAPASTEAKKVEEKKTPSANPEEAIKAGESVSSSETADEAKQ